MRLASVIDKGVVASAVVRDGRILPIVGDEIGLHGVRAIAASPFGLDRVRAWVGRQPERAYRALDDAELGPAVPDPGAIYTIGLNYRDPGAGSVAAGPGMAGPVAAGPEQDRPLSGRDRPLVYGKAPSSVAGHGATLSWDRSLTDAVDAEVELGVVVGATATAVAPRDALEYVFGYTIINDISSRDPWLDGDQWLIGKSMPGFCPVGPWVVTADEIDTTDLRLGCTINAIPIQDGATREMRFSIPEVIAYLSRHVTLRPGDLIATGTPARLRTPPGPERHLRRGDVVTAWIEQIGELTTTIA